MVSFSLTKQLEETLWSNGEEKPANVTVGYGFGPPPSCIEQSTFWVTPERKGNRDISTFHPLGMIKGEIRRLLQNDPGSIVRVIIDLRDHTSEIMVHVYARPTLQGLEKTL